VPGFRRNDKKWDFSTFYEIIIFDALQGEYSFKFLEIWLRLDKTFSKQLTYSRSTSSLAFHATIYYILRFIFTKPHYMLDIPCPCAKNPHQFTFFKTWPFQLQ